MPETSVKITYPTQQVYKCPVCGVSFSIYSSWTRHIATKHADTQLQLTFGCSTCDAEFESRRSVANHHTKIHGKPTTDHRRNEEAGTWTCEFCEGRFPNKKSRSQHIRNQHAAEASEQRATQAAGADPRFWTPEEHQLFLDALQRFGPACNNTLAKHIPSKSGKQVANHKRIFLRDNPQWRARFDLGTSSIQSSSSPTTTQSASDNTYHHSSDSNRAHK